MTEDEILTQIDIERALAKLNPGDAAMMRLVYRIEMPEDWGRRRWPPRLTDIGDYIGRKFETGPLSEAAIRYRRDMVTLQLAGRRGELRRQPPAGRRSRT